MNGNNKIIAIIASNSIHTIRYLNNIYQAFDKIILITNKQIANLPYNIEQYQINFQFKNIFAYITIANILKQYNIQTIQIHQANSYAFHGIRAIKRYNNACKIILTTWGSDILVLPKQNLISKKIVEFNLKNADIITSDSLYMSYQIRQLVPNIKQLYSINFGIDITHNVVSIADKKNIIFSNRLHKDLYQIDKIIIAFANLIKIDAYHDYQLIIAGDGPNHQYLQQLSHSLGLTDKEIKFIGFINQQQLVYWYRLAKIFVSIPLSDATSISLLEAMSFGCYPILSNIPANLELVINNINGKINENHQSLTLDMQQAIKQFDNKEEITPIIEQNYNIIKKFGNSKINSQQFIQLFND